MENPERIVSGFTLIIPDFISGTFACVHPGKITDLFTLKNPDISLLGVSLWIL
jgi:hypothetical protein